MNDEIEIFFHHQCETIQCKVKPFDPILKLFDFIKKNCQDNISFLSDFIFISNSIVLSGALSFQFYGIKDGSHIYSINKNYDKIKKSVTDLINFAHDKIIPTQYSHNSSKFNSNLHNSLSKIAFKEMFEKKNGTNYNPEFFESAYREHKRQKMSAEAAKLKDRFFQRIEGTVKCHRKFIRNFFQNSDNRVSTRTGNESNSDNKKI